ncbi:MAG: tocopherol cyclase family protein [Clostridiaceae bacterium]
MSSDSAFNINISGNLFSLEGINLKLQVDGLSIALEIHFKNIQRWPDTLINPGSMGFYNYLTFMECYSQVCAIDGNASGVLTINEKKYELTNSKVYIEKNWGKKFPYSWFWFQCNTFTEQELALTCSIAHIPFPIYSFRGFLAALRYGNEVITFTTMKRSKLKVIKEKDSLSFLLSNKDYDLIIVPESKEEDFLLLHSPDGEVMKPDVLESVVSKIKITLKEKNTGKVIAEDIGINAGIEYGGNYKELFD